MHNDTLLDILKSTAYHTLGIVPIDSTHHDVNKLLDSLPPEEARKMRRKFRKLWRRYAKGGTPKAYRDQMALGHPTPDRNAKRVRKMEVRRRVTNMVYESLRNETSKRDEGDTL